MLDPGLSDHALIFVTRKHFRPNKEKESIFVHDYRHFDEHAFACDLNNVDWSDVFSAGSVNDAVAMFNFLFLSVVNIHMPWRRIRTRRDRAPWITNEYLSLINTREYWSRKYRKSRTPDILCNKQNAIKACNRLRKELKKQFVEKSLSKFQNNPKKLWKCLRNFWPSNKSQSSFNSLGNYSNSEKANILNEHFVSVADKLGDDLPDTNIDNLGLQFCPPVFDIHEITTTDIFNAIAQLSNSLSYGDDGITAYMVKAAAGSILEPLQFIFNLSVNSATFPTLWRNAKVTPLFKGGDGSDPGNYRPISVLSTLGKLLERCIHKQCYKYLTDFDLLSSAQAGFRRRHSTDTCLAGFLDMIYQEVDNGGACGVLFLDLAKAFDTVDTDILIEKLRALGFKSNARKWFRSYLSDRSQVTMVNGESSSPGHLSSGVPQGSILGPLLFICYINDLPDVLCHTTPFIYADDTALVATGKSPSEISTKLNNDAANVIDWFKRNRLSCNVKKTKAQLFCNSRYRSKDVPLNVHMSGQHIDDVNCFKYLGVHLGSHCSSCPESGCKSEILYLSSLVM